MSIRGRNLLIGHGERLLQDGEWKGSGRTKPEPYTIIQQRSVLAPVLASLTEAARSARQQLAPRGEIAAKITIHPQFLAKTYFPDTLLRSTGLRLIGSRGTTIIPRRMVRGKEAREMATAVLIVAGTAEKFDLTSQLLQSSTTPRTTQAQFARLERIEPFEASDRKKGLDLARFDGWAEVVLHANLTDSDILDAFVSLTSQLGAEVDSRRARTIGGLTFLPLHVAVSRAPDFVRRIEEFTHLRAIRNMPLISTDPLDDRSDIQRTMLLAPALPDGPATDSDTRAVIFDGGFTPGLLPWVNASDAPGVPAQASSLAHGQAVTSAFLFGSIDETQQQIATPHCNVDHVRVLPSTANDLHVRDVIDQIIGTLQHARDSGRPYSLANISLGPRMPVLDDDPHEWTVRLDDFLSLGDLFMTVAAGNDGAAGPDLGRLQPPADAVNAFSVGASDGSHAKAQRAPYSCFGPGRSPGLVKPDAVAFGGVRDAPMRLLDPHTGMISLHAGTSFSAPLALRLAAGVRAAIAQEVQPIMLHALLVSRAVFNSRRHDQTEVGWGVLPQASDDILFSPADEVVVMYQGRIAKGQPLRAKIPLPPGLSTDGKVKIAATFAYRAPIDPAHPVSYTRAGLEIRFQPDGQTSEGFFSKTRFDTEQTLRDDALKWETCRHREKGIEIDKLTDPCFLIRYQGRDEGGDEDTLVLKDSTGKPLPTDQQPAALPFALVVRIKVPGASDLSTHVLQHFSVLSEVQLRTEIQV